MPHTQGHGATGVYVYGITPVDHPADLTAHHGVGAPPTSLRGLREAELRAVIGDAPPDLRARRRDLMAHQEVLLALTEGGPVLPMRFGTVASDEAALRSQLAAAAPGHRAMLDRLDGRVELNVKALPAQGQDSMAALVREDGNVRRLRQELRRRPGYEANVRLGEAVVSGLNRRAAQVADRAVRELAQLADAVTAGPEVAGCVLNTSFLVRQAQVERFQRVVVQFAEHHRERVELRVTGPLPCYSFVVGPRQDSSSLTAAMTAPAASSSTHLEP